MAHLNWKPFIMRPLASYADGQAVVAAPERTDAHVRHEWGVSPVFCDASNNGSEACDNFTLADLETGVSVIAGETTSGYWAYGVVMGWEPGKFFTYDGPQVGSLLWRKFLLLRGPIAEAARARYQERYGPRGDGEASPTVPMLRTDSGTSYNFTGRPDAAFWIRSGVEPFLFVTARHYQGRFPNAPRDVRELEGEMAQLREMLDMAQGPDQNSLELRACRYQLSVTTEQLAEARALLAEHEAEE